MPWACMDLSSATCRRGTFWLRRIRLLRCSHFQARNAIKQHSRARMPGITYRLSASSMRFTAPSKTMPIIRAEATQMAEPARS
ncbi:hypothetical protein D3C84_1251140 [compost metagenome]